jgi:hypothetical protein
MISWDSLGDARAFWQAPVRRVASGPGPTGLGGPMKSMARFLALAAFVPGVAMAGPADLPTFFNYYALPATGLCYAVALGPDGLI